MYTKRTQTNHYLNASFHHHSSQKFSVVNVFVYKAVKLLERYCLNSELDPFKVVFTQKTFNALLVGIDTLLLINLVKSASERDTKL